MGRNALENIQKNVRTRMVKILSIIWYFGSDRMLVQFSFYMKQFGIWNLCPRIKSVVLDLLIEISKHN